MPYIIWSSMYSINVPYIDNQHKKLFEIVNDFYASIKNDHGRETVFRTLNSLIQYAEQHFRDEEEIMAMAKYPDEEREAHKAKHEKLVEDIFALCEELEKDKELTVEHLELFLNEWLIQHVLLTDKKLQPYCSTLKNFVSQNGALWRF